MKPGDVALPAELRELWDRLLALRASVRDEAVRRYRRVNPFVEDLFDWKEKGRFVGGNDVTLYDSTTITGDVTIGDHTWIGPFVSLDGTGGLRIGSHCSVSAGTHILTHDTVKWTLSGGRSPYEYSPVIIGDSCFFGVAAIVTRGVTIGSRTVVAAGAVVTSDLPENSIAAGVPARVVGRVRVDDDGHVTLEYGDH
jgi:acetyltransferase-like isoleucine patch superfamily enzyme